MDAELKSLLDRMSVKNQDVKSSKDSISWNAHRDAEKLTNVEYIPLLIFYIQNEKSQDHIKSAYFALGKLAKNTDSAEALIFLVSRVSNETNKYVLSSLLDLIADLKKPASININPIISTIQDKRWQVRQAGIRALNYCKNHEAEMALIGILKDSTETLDLLYTCATLRNIGSAQSIPFLERFITSRNQDLKTTANAAIENIKTKSLNN